MNPIPHFFALLRKVGIDGFMFGIISMIVLAYIAPSVGAAKKPISLEQLANFGVSLIFFFYGLRLSMAKLVAGLANWKMHFVIQLSTFVFFPVILLLFKPLFDGTSAAMFWAGGFFLASLPSTVSSSVVMVSIAGGNIPAAIFNASISSLIGVFMTPLWAGLFIAGSQGGDFNAADIAVKLTIQVIVPVTLGILLNRKFGAFAEKHKKALKMSDQTVILLIIYTAFCKSFSEHIFDGFSAFQIIALGACMIALFFFVMGCMTLTGKILGFNRTDRITVLFCGSKKSLVHGSVMVKVLFPGNPATGILLLPLMMYHALQIIIASVLAKRIAKTNGQD
jgi:sodium/bile acid cotransporter 7